MALALLLSTALLAACRPQLSTAAAPTVVCGTTLADGAAGAVVEDLAARPAFPTQTGTTVGGVLIVRVSDDCAHGSVARIIPSSAARIVKSALAADGRSEAVVLKPAGSVPGRLVATRDGRLVGVLRFRIRSD